MTRFIRDDSPLFFPSPNRDQVITADDDGDADAEYEDKFFDLGPYVPSGDVPMTDFSSTDLDSYHGWEEQTAIMNAGPAPLSSSTLGGAKMTNTVKKRKRSSTSSNVTDTSAEGGVLLSSFAPSFGPAVPAAPAARREVEIIVIDSSDDEDAAPAPATSRAPVRAPARARAVAPAPANDDDNDDDNGGNTTDSSTTSGSSTGSAWDRKHGMKPWPGMTTKQQLSLMDRQKYYYGQAGTPLPPNRPYKPCPNLGDVVRKAEKRERRAKRAALKAARGRKMARK